MQRTDFEIRSFYDASQVPAPIVNQKLIVGLEERRRLVLTGNGLHDLSPTDILLVDNRREKSRKILIFVCLLGILASQTQLGLSDLAQSFCWIVRRTMPCSFHHRRGD